MLFGLTAMLAAGSSRANVITVDTLADVDQSSNSCSLRNAIAAANTQSPVGSCTAGSGSDTIRVPSGTISLGRSIEISASITFAGASTSTNYNIDPLTGQSPTRTLPTTVIALASGSTDRLFKIDNGVSVSFTDMVLRDGNASATTDSLLHNGGAVWSASSVTFNNVRFINNTALGEGGAVFLNGAGTTITATVTSFIRNQSGSGGSAISSTCYSAAAAESHTYDLNQDLFFHNRAITSPSTIAPAVKSCGDLTVTLSNDTFFGNDQALALTGRNVTPVNVNSATVTLNHLTVVGQVDTGLDFTNAEKLTGITMSNSVIAFNGASGSSNCSSFDGTISNSTATSSIYNNRTGHGCSVTDGYSTNTQGEKDQALAALDGGIFLADNITINPNYSNVFYVPPSHANAVDQFEPSAYGGLTGVLFPTPGSGLLIGQAKTNCDAVDQRGVKRGANVEGCSVGAVEPKQLSPVDDSGQNLSSTGAARTVTVSVLDNDTADEDGSGDGGQRWTVARVDGSFSPTDCDNLNGGTISLVNNGTQIEYFPLRTPITWKGAQVPGPGLTTPKSVTCKYLIDSSKGVSDVSQRSGTVTFTVADIAPIARSVTYTRPYNGEPFPMSPLVGGSDPDGMDGELPPAGPARASNNYSELLSSDCSVRQLVKITGKPSLGTVTGNIMAVVVAGSNLTTYYDGNLVYTPHNSYSPFGDSFQYQVLDADCQPSNIATVTVLTDAPSNTTSKGSGGRGGSFDSLMLGGGLLLLLLRAVRRSA
jgi:CSLREA domain-containing protein